MTTTTPVLETRYIARASDKLYTLKGADLTVRLDEIHTLMGGSGTEKGTPVKILIGTYTAASGGVLIDRELQTIRGPKDVLAVGIALIHQEMQLISDLTVTENIFLGNKLARGGLM